MGNKRFRPEEPDFERYVIYTDQLYFDAARNAEVRGVTMKSIEDAIPEPGRCIIDFRESRRRLFSRYCSAHNIATDIDGYICIRTALERYCVAFGLNPGNYIIDPARLTGERLEDQGQEDDGTPFEHILAELKAIRALIEEIRREHGVEY